jgi:replicative DNA helicase
LHEEYVEPNKAEETQKYKELMLIIAKQREGERNICCDLKFYGNTQRFYQD